MKKKTAKRLGTLLPLLALTLSLQCTCITAFAAGSGLITKVDRIELAKDQTSFQLEFLLEQKTPAYAAFEFTLEMSDEINVNYEFGADTGTTAQATKERGAAGMLHHTFSIAKPQNVFSDELTMVTLELGYTGEAQQLIKVVDAHYSYQVSGGIPRPEPVDPGISITVARAAASSGSSSGRGGSNSVTPEVPPVETGEEEDELANNSPAFFDIENHWGRTEIEEAVRRGFVVGYPDGTFRPDQTVSRAEYVRMLTTACNMEDRAAENFTDTDAHWAQREIQTAVSYGAVAGYPDGTFRPDNGILREEMASSLGKIITMPAGFIMKELTFSDREDISSWAVEAVQNLYSASIMMGTPEGRLLPKNEVTRAEAVALILRSITTR